MATEHTHSNAGVVVFLLVVAAVAALAVGLALALCPYASTVAPAATGGGVYLEQGGDDGVEDGGVGFAGRVPDSTKPKLTAYFERESYRRGGTARLVILDTAPSVALQIFRTGTENTPTLPRDVMLGSPVSATRSLGPVHGRRLVEVRLGDWPSGVYFAQLSCGDRVGYAPFVLAPRRLGAHRVAVVMPTETWQAYNFRDDDGDGDADTWYAGWHTHRALLIRPFQDRGVPPHWKHYDAPFVHWLVSTGHEADFLSDAELRAVPSGAELAKAYDLIVFSGHHEYVTTHEYDVVQQYRDLGGNLAFLSANNFYWKITLDGAVMTRVVRWRDIGRPEAALIGVQYRANDDGTHRAPWVLRNTASARWLFAGTGLKDGDELSNGGIEIDRTYDASPQSVHVLGEIRDLFGPGYTAQMTYYETKSGAKVFANGAFSLAGALWQPTEAQLMANIWEHLAS